MPFETLLIQKEEPLAIVTINRPEALNALNMKVLEELDKAVIELEADSGVKVLIITGAGEKSFVSGADIKDVAERDVLSAFEFVNKGQAVFAKIEKMSKPVIAAVNGYALGGGCELALACDFILASTGARFGFPEASIGVFAGWGGIQRLSRRVGLGWAKQMNLTGDPIDAQTAKEIGLANLVFPPEKLMEEAKKIALRITRNAPIPVMLIKTLANEGFDLPLERALALDAKASALCFASEDRKEGMRAFIEKRKPVFKGR